jgi:mycothiol system anti-sigma-R factor
MTREIRCEDVIEKLLEFLDRELDPQTEAELAHHMEHCRACFSRAEFERQLRSKVADVGQSEAPDRLRRRMRALMERF